MSENEKKCTCGFADMSPKEWFGVPDKPIIHAKDCPRSATPEEPE